MRLEGQLTPLGLESLTIDWQTLLGPLVKRLPDPARPLPLTLIGAHSPEARYLIDLCCQWPDLFRLRALGPGPRPVYLSARRYRSVCYRRWSDGPLEAPAGPVFLLAPPPRDMEPQHAYRQVERLELLLSQGLSQLICLTGLSPVKPDAIDRIDRELEATGRRLCSPSSRFVALRAPDRYGPHGGHGLLSIAYLMAHGQLLAPPAPDQTPIASLHLADLARALLGLALRPPDAPHSIFEWGPAPIPLAELLGELDVELPRTHLMGEPSGLTRLLGIGYQTDVVPPYHLARQVPLLRDKLERLLDPLRYRSATSHFSLELIEHLFRPAPTPDHQALTARLGFAPLPGRTGLREAIQCGTDCDWRQFKPTQQTSPDGATERALADRVEQILDALERLDSSDGSSRGQTVVLPVGEVTIDIQSLSILLEQIRRQSSRELLDEGVEGLLARGIPGLLGGLRDATRDWVRHAGEQTLEGPGDLISRLLRTVHELGGELLGDMGRHLRRALLLQLIKGIEANIGQFAPLLQLLPERRIGLLLDGDRGTVGVVLAAGEGRLEVSFPREQVDRLARFPSAEKRLAEFRKEQKLDAAAGARLATLLADVRRGKLISRLLHQGEHYQIAGSTTHYRLLSKEMFGTPYARTLFTQQGKLVLGISTTGGSLNVLSEEEVALYERLRLELSDGDVEALASVLSSAHPTRESTRVLRLGATRKLIGEVLRPSALGRILALFERRAARAKRAREAPSEPPEASE